jgi:hypothetical protein
MALTKTERATIENIVKRLKKPNCGGSFRQEEQVSKAVQNIGMVPETIGFEDCPNNRIDQLALVPRIYLDTWVIPALELMLSDDPNNKRTALALSR